ncbi:MAG: insulinase family protein [Polyangiaceae bacterium]|nr:insulinase family protein [Polyangiaceae bacterium]
MNRSIVLAIFGLLAMGCGNAPIVVPPPQAPPPDPVIMNNSAALPMVEDPSFRKEPPQPEADVRFVPPKIEEAHLSNGLRVLVAERRDMPIVAMQIVVDRGLDLQTLPGVATMTATMMLTGTKSRSALALSDDLAAIGARYGAWANHDGMGVRGQALRERFPELFAILVDVVRNPAFDGVELERERAKRLTTLAAQTDVPDVLMENAVEEKLYPLGHPYHAPLNGDEASTKAIKASDLVRLHEAAFRPEHATVAIAGDIDRASAVALVEKHLGNWVGKALPKRRIPILGRSGKTKSAYCSSIGRALRNRACRLRWLAYRASTRISMRSWCSIRSWVANFRAAST